MEKSTKPLPQHFLDFIDWCAYSKGLSSNTQRNYSQFLKAFEKYLKEKKIHAIKPHELTLEIIDKYRSWLSRRTSSRTGLPIAKSTQNYYIIAIRSLLDYFVHKDIESLPPEKIELMKDTDDDQVRFLTLKEIQKLFSVTDTATLKGLRDRAILETFFSTGLRLSELIALNKNQIVFPQNEDEELEISIKGKGGKVRPVYLSPTSLSWIKKYLAKRSDEDPALFIGTIGKKRDRLSDRTIENIVKKYAIKAGLPMDITPHVLRHSNATYLLQQGVDLRSIQSFLGHSDISSTQIYTHVTNKRLKEIHKKLYSRENTGQ